jgi:hypothetical protein
MNLLEYQAKVRTFLKDPGGAEPVWISDELDRCVQQAVYDLSRYLPQEKVCELTYTPTVTDEGWVSAAAPGTYVSLANKPIAAASETVKNAAGTVIVRDKGYTIDYWNGRITHISGGGIGNGESCTVTYTKSSIIVDLSSLSDLLRIVRVECPVGSTPQTFNA